MKNTDICDSMHNDLQTLKNYVVQHVYIPKGAQIPGTRSAKQQSFINLCMEF